MYSYYQASFSANTFVDREKSHFTDGAAELAGPSEMRSEAEPLSAIALSTPERPTLAMDVHEDHRPPHQDLVDDPQEPLPVMDAEMSEVSAEQVPIVVETAPEILEKSVTKVSIIISAAKNPF